MRTLAKMDLPFPTQVSRLQPHYRNAELSSVSRHDENCLYVVLAGGFPLAKAFAPVFELPADASKLGSLNTGETYRLRKRHIRSPPVHRRDKAVRCIIETSASSTDFVNRGLSIATRPHQRVELAHSLSDSTQF